MKIPLAAAIEERLRSTETSPWLIHGEARDSLRSLPDDCIDCCLTSPPYWGHRRYSSLDPEHGGLGTEREWTEYVESLLGVLREVARVLKPTGSLWLNLGDTYRKKEQLGIPWRVAFALTDHEGWTLRNSVVWHKVKGGLDPSKDRLRNVHELVFHLVRMPRGYHYDVDAIRSPARSARVEGGAVVSATGVRGVRYRRQIELSSVLSADEKQRAERALDDMLDGVRRGELSDFRMVIRGQQRTTHSDSRKVSGRARELEERGFYLLRYHPKGSKPSDVWDIMPEDSQNRRGHFAAYPEDLCRIPIRATCPEGGWVLDPFCGTGTTLVVAQEEGRRSLGIELSAEYVELARERCG